MSLASESGRGDDPEDDFDDDCLLKLARRSHPSISVDERRAMEANGNPEEDWRFLTLPPECSGHNAGLMRMADLLLNVFQLSEEEAFDHMRTEYLRDNADIFRALDRARGPSTRNRRPKFLPADPRLTAAAIGATTGSVSKLRGLSPVNPDVPALEVIRCLMRARPGNDPLVCVGRSAKKFHTTTLSEWGETPRTRPYIVPQPMTAREGLTKGKNPHLSPRSDANTSPDRLNQVVEFDELDKDAQAACIMFLSRYVRLETVCDSGGRSLHAYFNVAGRPLKEQEDFMRVACQLGADRALWTLSQFARIPGGRRPAVPADGDTPERPAVKQEILYYDPSAATDSEGWRVDALVAWAADIAGNSPVANPADDLPLCYYDGSRFLLDNGRDYVPMDRRSVHQQLERQGYKPAAEVICRIQMERFVKYFGPLAGRKRGLYGSNGDLLLASTGPRIIKSVACPFPTIREFLALLFGGDEHADVQLASFMGWLKTARHALLANLRRPGQALVLAGPIQCGKTLLIKLLIIPALGGRSANPFRYLTGRTNFNGDLIGAETLVIDDETASTRIETRRALGDGIKSTLFSSSVRIEAKNKNGFHFDPLWRLVIAVNDVPENLMVLPPLSPDLADKLMILKCWKAIELHDDAFETWSAKISAELPGFLHAVENFKIASEDAEGRCGVKTFMHPDIVDAIGELSAERRLRNLIDTLAATGGISLPWEGSASQLRAKLTAPEAITRADAERLLGSWPAGTGAYLARLKGVGVTKLKLLHGDQQWRIENLDGEAESDDLDSTPDI